MLSARLILVRHGQSTYNAAGPPPGPGRSAALRRRTRRGASCWARAAALRDDRSSPATSRARSETAALLGYPDAPPRPALARDRRRRVGGPPAARTSRPAPSTAWRGGPLTAARRRVAGRTSQARVGGAVDELVAAGGTWLVVCHGGVVRAALSHVTGADPRRDRGPGERQRHGDPRRRARRSSSPTPGRPSLSAP